MPISRREAGAPIRRARSKTAVAAFFEPSAVPTSCIASPAAFCIEGDRMRQDDAVSLRMRKTERAPKHVTELVMEGHGSTSENDSTEPRTVKRVMSRTDGPRFLDDFRQRLRKGGDAFARHVASTAGFDPSRRVLRRRARLR